MKKNLLIIVLLVLIIFITRSLFFEQKAYASNKPFIAVTNFPLYEISNKLLKDKINIEKLIPFGVEAHAYTPSVKTMIQVSKAELFIYSGLGMEPWIIQKYTNAINMSKFVHLQEMAETHHHNHPGQDENSDPHYWLDLENMIRMTLVLSNNFVKEFPELKSMIKKNEQAYIRELKSLQKKYTNKLKTCERREIVLNHNAFGYLGHSYNFTSHTLTGLSPEEQVSAKKMKEITDLVKKEGIKTIFFESFVSDKISQTIAKETGARVDSLQPLANVTKEEASKGYIVLMQENLEKLSLAMECK